MLGFDPNGPQFQDAGAPADPGMPAPPMPQPTMPTPGQSGLTLGQANPQVPQVGPAANPYLQNYAQHVEAVKQMLAGARREPLPDQGGPSGLAKFFNIGGAAGWDQYKQGYNIGVDRYNKGLDLQAGVLARELMHDEATGDLANFNQQLKILQATIGVKRFMQQEADDKIKQDLGQTVPEPKTPEEQRMRDAQGYGPSSQFPNRLSKQPGGGWALGTPAAPGSPAAAAGLGGPSAPTASASSGPNPGESPADYTARKTAEDKKAATLAVPTGMTRTMAETAPDVLDAIQKVRDDLKNVKTGPVLSRAQSWGTALGLSNPAFKTYQTDVGLLRGLVIKMHAGARGGGNRALVEQYKQMLDAGKDAPQNMGASLDSIENYTRNISKHGAEGLGTAGSSTTTTPGSGESTRPTSGSLGSAPSSLEDLLKKHGY